MPTQFSSSAGTVRGLTRAALCTACACLLAPVSIPIGPVSLTLGVFAILLAGALLPPALAALSACAYLLLGFAGLPVFAGFAAGPGVLFGMTGGYLLAYPIMAWLLSMVCEKTRSRGVRMAGWHWQTCAVTCWAPPGSWLPPAWDCGRPSRPV